MFALRAHPTRPLRGGRIYARLGLEGRERKRGVACADVRLFEYERYPLPREGDDVVGETHGAWNAADNVAGAIRGVFFHEGPEMPCVGERGRFAVFDLHGDELSAALDHPVYFRACGIAPESKTGGGNRIAPDMAEKFKSHELFELPSFFHFGRVDAFPCRDAADAEVEEEMARGLGETLADWACGYRLDALCDQAVFKDAVVGGYSRMRDADPRGEVGEVHDETGFGCGEFEEPGECAEVADDGLLSDFLLKIGIHVGVEVELPGVVVRCGHYAGQGAVCEPSVKRSISQTRLCSRGPF